MEHVRRWEGASDVGLQAAAIQSLGVRAKLSGEHIAQEGQEGC